MLKWGIHGPEGWILYLTPDQLLTEEYQEYEENRCVAIVSGAYVWNDDNEPFAYTTIPGGSTANTSILEPAPV